MAGFGGLYNVLEQLIRIYSSVVWPWKRKIKGPFGYRPSTRLASPPLVDDGYKTKISKRTKEAGTNWLRESVKFRSTSLQFATRRDFQKTKYPEWQPAQPKCLSHGPTNVLSKIP